MEPVGTDEMHELSKALNEAPDDYEPSELTLQEAIDIAIAELSLALHEIGQGDERHVGRHIEAALVWLRNA